MSFEIHNKEIKDECDALLNYFRFVRNATKDKSFDLDNKLDHVIDYIAKLERENLGLKEYKLHQERANERRYRSGVVGKSPGTEGQLSQRRSRWTK